MKLPSSDAADLEGVLLIRRPNFPPALNKAPGRELSRRFSAYVTAPAFFGGSSARLLRYYRNTTVTK